MSSGAIAFLHELQAADGSRRLIRIDYSQDLMDAGLRGSVNLISSIYRPVSWSAKIASPCSSTNIIIPERYEEGSTTANLRIFAGQSDPADPSHFTIRYQIWGLEDVIDGRLTGAETIVLTPRGHLRPPRAIPVCAG